MKRLCVCWCLLIVLLAGCDGNSTENGNQFDLLPVGWGADGVPNRLIGEGPPCVFTDWVPFYNVDLFCFEVVYNNVTPPEAAPALTGLAFGADGTLYMARTAFGEIWAMPDANGDQVLDDPVLAADGLDLPTGITVHEGALYVIGAGRVIRLEDPDDDGYFQRRTLLVNDLPRTAGFWTGSIGIGPDERLYISQSASCATCEPGQDIRPGMVRSYDLDGNDPRIEATGLHNPADFAWEPESGQLWILDSGPFGGEETPDELNRYRPKINYGFPYCYGVQVPSPGFIPPREDFCTRTASPDVTFPYQSYPSGLAFYTGDTFPFWQGRALVALNGSWSTPNPSGYALVVVAVHNPDSLRVIIPSSKPPYPANSVTEYSLLGRGFFPYHPVDVVVSQEGWIYISMAEGRIFRIRSRPPRANTG